MEVDQFCQSTHMCQNIHCGWNSATYWLLFRHSDHKWIYSPQFFYHFWYLWFLFSDSKKLQVSGRFSVLMATFSNRPGLASTRMSLSFSFSLRFNGHFPGEPELACVYCSKGWWRRWWQLGHWSYKSCKAAVKPSPPTNQHPVFYRPDALPVAQPTASEHWSGNQG